MSLDLKEVRALAFLYLGEGCSQWRELLKQEHPNTLEKQQGGPRDWARGRDELQEGAGNQNAVGFVGCLGALAFTLSELEKHDRVCHSLTEIYKDCAGCCVEKRLQRERQDLGQRDC